MGNSIYIFDHISLNSSYNEEIFQTGFVKKMKTQNIMFNNLLIPNIAQCMR